MYSCTALLAMNLTLESTPDDAELLNRIFRALHTIKGTAGFLAFEPVVRLGHRVARVGRSSLRGAGVVRA